MGGADREQGGGGRARIGIATGFGVPVKTV